MLNEFEILWRMNKRDQELLDKQLGRIVPAARHDGTMILAVVAVFFVGLALGAILFPRGNELAQIASNDTSAPVSFTDGARPNTRP